MVAGLKKHQPYRAPRPMRPMRRWQPSKFAYTVVVRQSAFQGQQRAFTSLMLPGGICNQPLKTAAATLALAALCACVVVAMAIICRGLSMGRAVQKFRTPAKRGRRRRRRHNRRSSESAPTCTRHNHRDPSFFRRKTLHVNQ
jgi:hypothetical protein